MSQQLKRHFLLIILSLTIIAFASCSRYYKAIKSTASSETVDNLQNQNRYFILRSGSEAYYMTKIAFSDDRQTLQCELDILPQIHTLYLSHGGNGKMRYIASQHDDVVLSEVHVFMKSSDSIHTGPFSMNMNQIQKMDIIEKDKKRTTNSYILGGVIAAATVIPFVFAISAATKVTSPNQYVPNVGCSPQAYTVINNRSELNGTLCSGAIYASLKRTDYLPVNKIDPNSDTLNLIVRGEKNEELMLKNFQLMQVNHGSQQKILVDKNGQVLAYRNPIAPLHAFIGQGIDVLRDINAPDEKYYSFTNQNENGGSSVVLDFTKPLEATSGKLIVRGKNSNWAYYVFNEFKKLYGTYYQSLILKKDKANPSRVLQCEVNQSLPLMVSVNNGKGWKIVDYFFTPGNAASRDMIMQLNLNDFKNQDHIQIKLQTVYRFWDIDYAAIDFSNDLPVSVSYIMPTEFYKSGNISQPVQFSKNDTSCLHILGNEQLHITFKVNDNAGGAESTYFLKGDGYYHDKTVFKGKPQLTELRKCTGKGAFDNFSRRRFEEALGASNHQ